MADFKYLYHPEMNVQAPQASFNDLLSHSNGMHKNDLLFNYGTTDKGKIYADMMEDQRRAAEESAFRQMQDQAAINRSMEEDAVLAEQKRNRLGIGPLSSMVNDPGSTAYESVDPATGNAPTPYVDISVGDMQGGAPAPLPAVRSRGLSPLRRQIRPEYQDALDAQRTDDSVAPMRPQDPYDNPLRRKQTMVDQIATYQKMLDGMQRSDPGRAEIQTRIGGLMKTMDSIDNIGGGAPQLVPNQTAPTATPAQLPVAIEPPQVSVLSGAPTLQEFEKFYRAKRPNATPQEIQDEFTRRGGRA